MIISTQEYTITAAGTTTLLDLDGTYQEFWFRTTVAPITLAGNVSIAPDPGDTPTTDLVVIRCSWRMILNGRTVSVFGVNIDQEMALNDLRIECKYDTTASAWRVSIMEDISELPLGVPGVETTGLLAAGSTNNLVYGINKNIQRYTTTGTITLAAGITIQGTGTPTTGAGFLIDFSALCTYAGGNTVTIGGIVLNALQAVSGLVMAYTYYDGTAWRTTVWDRHGNDTYRVMGSSGDTAPAYLDSKVKMSVIVDANQICLDADDATPGNFYYYGTNDAGAKGFYRVDILEREGLEPIISGDTVITFATAFPTGLIPLGLTFNAYDAGGQISGNYSALSETGFTFSSAAAGFLYYRAKIS